MPALMVVFPPGNPIPCTLTGDIPFPVPMWPRSRIDAATPTDRRSVARASVCFHPAGIGPARAHRAPSETGCWCRCFRATDRPNSREYRQHTLLHAPCNRKVIVRPEIPSRRRLSIITSVSRLSRTPVSDETPSARAATTKARFVRLFEPGGRMDPTIGRQMG